MSNMAEKKLQDFTEYENLPPSFEIYLDELFNVLNFLKMSPSKNMSTIRKLFSTCFTSFFLMILATMWIAQLLSLKLINDIESLSAHVSEFNYICIGLFKWIFCMLQYDQLDDIIKALKSCHSICQKINEHDRDNKIYHLKMLEAKKSSHQFKILWSSIIAFGVIQWCINAYIYDYLHRSDIDMNIENTSKRYFPLRMIIPYKTDTSYKFASIYWLHALSLAGTSIGFAAYDFLCTTILIFMCAQLNYLSETLVDEEDLKLILRSNSPGIKMWNKFKKCALHHSRVLNVHKAYEKFSSRPMFFQCINLCLDLCLISIQASTMRFVASANFFLAFTSLMEFWTGAAFELGAYCYYGTKIETVGLQVTESFYYSNWDKLKIDDSQNMEKHIHSILRFSIMRAQQPIIITGGPFYNMNLPTFKTLMYMSISNAVVLRQVAAEE